MGVPQRLALLHDGGVRWSMSKTGRRWHGAADAVFTWIERIPGAKTVVLVAVAVTVTELRESIMDSPRLFLYGAAVGLVLGLLVWVWIAQFFNARNARRLIRGLVDHLDEFDAFLADINAQEANPDAVRAIGLHQKAWRVGHLFENAGVKCPDGDRPNMKEWQGFLVTATHYIREGDHKELQELHLRMPPAGGGNG